MCPLLNAAFAAVSSWKAGTEAVHEASKDRLCAALRAGTPTVTYGRKWLLLPAQV